MANTPYENYFLANEIEDQYKSKLALQSFCKINNDLVGTAGMKYTVHKYAGTGTAEKVAQGIGNTANLQAAYTSKDYEILCAQSRAQYFDEEAMKDPYLINALINYQAVDLFNTVNADIYAAFNEATVTSAATDFGFGTFVDAEAKLNLENLEGVTPFAFVCPNDMASIRKALKDDLKYVETFVKTGYVGTVGGCNLYTKKDAVSGTIIMATADAVTLFNKPGVSAEQDRDKNIRSNFVYARKYYLAAMTDATKAVKITVTKA